MAYEGFGDSVIGRVAPAAGLLSWWDRVVVTCIVMATMLHMTVTQTSLSLLTCTTIEAEEQLGTADLSGTTDTGVVQTPEALQALPDGCPAEHPARRLLRDFNVCCHDPHALSFMFGAGISGVLLYAIGIPLGSAALLCWVRNKKGDPRLRAMLGFLQAGYKDTTYYWEVVIMLRKVGVASVAVFLEPFGVGVQTYAVVGMLFGLAILHVAI